jgi:Tol biopolymer transport system component
MNLKLNAIMSEAKFTGKRKIFLFPAFFFLIALSVINVWAESGKIAYSYDNAIYKMNPDGTSVQQLTFTTASQKDFSPVWSPDGTKIAFVRSNSTQQVTSGGGGDWWSGEETTVHTVTTYSIYTMGSGGANLTLIRNSPSFINDLTWSPDGTKLAYVYGADTTFAGIYQTCSGNSHIYIVNAVEGGNANPVAAAVGGIDPSWSSDGAKIFYAVNNNPEKYGIYSLNLSTNSVQRLTYDGAAPADPEISPDGTKIVYATGYAEEQCIAGNMSTMGPVKMYTYRGSLILYDIAQNSYLMLTSGASSPTWQPGGNLILYISAEGQPSETTPGQELTTITATGQNRTQIQNWQSGETSGSWSP